LSHKLVDPAVSRGSALPPHRIQVFEDVADLGSAAATRAADAIAEAVTARGVAHVMLAAAPSQAPLLAALARRRDLPWERVVLFHMDEYVGLPPEAPQLFSRWLHTHLQDLPVSAFHEIRSDAPDPVAESRRYAALLREVGRFDVTFLGVGVNGHLAFNEPGQARLDDPEDVRTVALQQPSRQQQVDDGLFDSLDLVPDQAITATVPALLRTRLCLLSALGESKAEAVRQMLLQPVSMTCPASAVRMHDEVYVYLDTPAAERLPEGGRR
jgi:glucosamine-6-phosphate deaminase